MSEPESSFQSLGASRLLRQEILNTIRRYGQESDVTVYQAIGVLEIVKLDLVEIMEQSNAV